MSGLRYIDVCSGISAPTCAWKPLGWQALCFAEIEAAPRAVLAHHYPHVPLRGDFTEIEGDEYGPVDLLVGGTPCQSFSVAGLRGGLDDDRGNLALQFVRLADRARPRWVVWENVPGVLSSGGGRDFGSILGALGKLGYGAAYRVLDAQYFGVPQRRRRVFVVGYLGDWRRAAAVLFERHSLSGYPAPRRKAGEGVAGTIKACAGKSGTPNGAEEADRLICAAVTSKWAKGAGGPAGDECQNLIAHSLRAQSQMAHRADVDTLVAHPLPAEGFDASEDGTGRGTPLAPVCFSAKDHGADAGDIAPTLRAGGHSGSHANAGVMPAIALAGTAETMYGVTHADAAQAYPDQALRTLRDAVGEEAYSEWSLGVATTFRTPEVLRSAMHGGGFRRTPHQGRGMVDDASSCPQAGGGGAVLALWEAGCLGCPPRGWRPPEQLARELVAHLSELPHQRASAARFLLGMWRAGEGLGPVRQALSALQEAWRPEGCEGQSTPLTSTVRRLTPRECERLMGFPDDYTLVPHRGKPMADGPRYKMLGNSMAVPVVRWIGERIAAVDALAQPERLAA